MLGAGASLLAAVVLALAGEIIHPVAWLMGAAITLALATRLVVRRFSEVMARLPKAPLAALFPDSPPPASRETGRGSRWRRLEAARTSLVIPPAGAKMSKPTRA